MSASNMNNKFTYGTIAFSCTWKPNIKNIKPQTLTNFEKDTYFFVSKNAAIIGTKNDKIIIIVVEGSISGRIFKLLTVCS